MAIYLDKLTGDELVSDSFPRKELLEGTLWEVEGKLIDVPQADEGVEGEDLRVIDIVQNFRLQPVRGLNEREFKASIQKLVSDLTPLLNDEEQALLNTNIEPVTQYLLSKLQDLDFYAGASMHEGGSPVFAYCEEGTPIFIYFAHCLKKADY